MVAKEIKFLAISFEWKIAHCSDNGDDVNEIHTLPSAGS